jgi:hypothetical protein
MNAITDWGQAFLTAISNAFSKLFGFLPDLIGALLILWIGWIVAGWLSKLVANVLRKVRFNEAANKAGLSGAIQSAGVRQDASGVMAEVVKWFFRLIALVAAFSVLQLPALTAALTGILDFIPNLFVALVIVLIGGLIANFAKDFVRGAASSAGFSNANLVSNIARYAILYVAVIAALGQIGIAATVINTLFIGTIAALALALGLAFGLGGRDVAARMWENGYNSAQSNLPRLSQGMRQRSQQARLQAQQAAQQYSQPQPTAQQYSQPHPAAQLYTQPQQPQNPNYHPQSQGQTTQYPNYTAGDYSQTQSTQSFNTPSPGQGTSPDGGYEQPGRRSQGQPRTGQHPTQPPNPNYYYPDQDGNPPAQR